MGQALSAGPGGHQTKTREEFRRELKFATKCFDSIELYSLKDNFKCLADVQQGVHHLKEDTVAKFLELPDVLHVSPVLFQMLAFLGAFPFLQDAPAVLGLEELLLAVTILTERYRRVLSKGATDRVNLLFKSLAVYDRHLAETQDVIEGSRKEGRTQDAVDLGPGRHRPGFEIDEPGDDDPDDEDDGLVLSTFELLGFVDAFKAGSVQKMDGAMIPADNLRRLVMLLLLAAPLSPQERLSQYSDQLVGIELERLRSAAENITAAFLNVEQSPGIHFRAFNNVLPVSLPYMFDTFNALFEHFLFSKNLDFTRHKEGDSRNNASSSPTTAPPLVEEAASIMNATVLSQLSFFIPGSSLFRRVRLLYSGDKDGFSMGSLESTVFNWRAPTILLVRGTRILDSSSRSKERLAASLPPKRFPDGSNSSSNRLTYGMYVSQPWRHSRKECFGDSDTLLFQLEPIHDVFPASELNKDYVSFMKPGSNTSNTGISVGNPLPKSSSYRKEGIAHLGSVALLLDSSFEFGVFTHDSTSRGGAFQTSVSRKFDFQDRFEIEAVEVWGCGGDREAKLQAERSAFEEREAEARRRINLGTGDIEADRTPLEMAGLIGGNRSGGSTA